MKPFKSETNTNHYLKSKMCCDNLLGHSIDQPIAKIPHQASYKALLVSQLASLQFVPLLVYHYESCSRNVSCTQYYIDTANRETTLEFNLYLRQNIWEEKGGAGAGGGSEGREGQNERIS